MRRRIWTFLGWGVLAAAALFYFRALRWLGDSADIHTYQRIAGDTRLDREQRGKAWMKIVAIGDEKAERALAALDTEPPPEHATLAIPSPIPLLPWIERRAQEAPSSFHREARGSALLRLPDRSRLVLFRGTSIGGADDLWLARLTEDGILAEGPWFTGASLQEAVRGEKMSLSLKDGQLTAASASGVVCFPLDLKVLAADRDRDGLTDLVELRLRLDPENSDSDGDGLADDIDPAPNARIHAPETEEEARKLALFEQFLRLTPHRELRADRTAMIVWDESALEWRGRGGPTITLPPADFDEFIDSAGVDGIGHLTVKSWEASERSLAQKNVDACGPLQDSEVAYEVRMFYGGLDAADYCVVLRPLAGRWYVRHLPMSWVS